MTGNTEGRRQSGRAGVKGGMLGHLGGVLRVGTPRDGMGNCTVFLIYAQMNVSGVPAVDRINVIWARGRNRNQIVKRLHDDIVTWSGPGLVTGDIVVLPINPGIEEQINSRPGAPRLDARKVNRQH